MTIGFDGSRAFVTGRTGTENYSYQLLKALAKIDRTNQYVVYVRQSSVIPSSVIPARRFEEASTLVVKAGIYTNIYGSPCLLTRLIRSGMTKENWPDNFQFRVINWSRLWTQAGLAIQTFKDSLDVLFVPAHTLPVIRKPGLKTVITVHDLGSEYLPSAHQLKQRLYLGFMQKYQLKTATKIISVSKSTKQDLINTLGIEEKKIKVVYEGYDQKVFKPVEGDTLVNSLMHYNLKPKTYYLFVGTVQPRKNLERLIIAFSRQSSVVRLVIAGSKGWLSDKIYKLPKKLGIEDKVKFLGYIPEEDLPALYSGALAFTFPSLFEGFGLPILEAQACGCPILTSNLSSMPEVAGEGAVYINPYNIDDIVNGMRRIQNLEFRVKNVKAGLENIKRFSWEKCAKETLKALEETVVKRLSLRGTNEVSDEAI